MMKIKDIVSETTAAFIGTITDTKSALRFIEFFKYNSNWLPVFKIFLVLNGDKQYIESFIQSIKNLPHYKNSNISFLYVDNLGPVFGAMYSDTAVFNHLINDQDTKYIFKFSLDVVANESLLEVDIDDNYDFFYINNIGYAALQQYTKSELFDAIKTQEYFYPQTNYYIIKNKITSWYPSIDTIHNLQAQYNNILKEYPTYQPWDAIPDCNCEAMLRKVIQDNGLKSCHLLNDKDTKKVIELIDQHKIVDGSHKNIMYVNVGGLCHLHYNNFPVAPIE